VSSDETVEILDGADREFDARHVLELVERNRFAGESLPVAELCALEGARDRVEKRGGVACVGVGVIQCAGMKRPQAASTDSPGERCQRSAGACAVSCAPAAHGGGRWQVVGGRLAA
jgi:hypothetical protein